MKEWLYSRTVLLQDLVKTNIEREKVISRLFPGYGYTDEIQIMNETINEFAREVAEKIDKKIGDM